MFRGSAFSDTSEVRDIKAKVYANVLFYHES